MNTHAKRLRINRLFLTLLTSALYLILGTNAFYTSKAVADSPEWEKDVKGMLTEFLSCKDPIDDKSPCNVFLGRALKRVYAINDFDDTTSPIGYLTANKIALQVEILTDKWTKLGNASAQNALNEAQGQANLKRPVIAVWRNPDNNKSGHVALILPGSLTQSGSWGLKVPNSASFTLGKPENAYVGGPLSKAFGADKKATLLLYGRNYSGQ